MADTLDIGEEPWEDIDDLNIPPPPSNLTMEDKEGVGGDGGDSFITDDSVIAMEEAEAGVDEGDADEVLPDDTDDSVLKLADQIDEASGENILADQMASLDINREIDEDEELVEERETDFEVGEKREVYTEQKSTLRVQNEIGDAEDEAIPEVDPFGDLDLHAKVILVNASTLFKNRFYTYIEDGRTINHISDSWRVTAFGIQENSRLSAPPGERGTEVPDSKAIDIMTKFYSNVMRERSFDINTSAPKNDNKLIHDIGGDNRVFPLVTVSDPLTGNVTRSFNFVKALGPLYTPTKREAIVCYSGTKNHKLNGSMLLDSNRRPINKLKIKVPVSNKWITFDVGVDALSNHLEGNSLAFAFREKRMSESNKPDIAHYFLFCFTAKNNLMIVIQYSRELLNSENENNLIKIGPIQLRQEEIDEAMQFSSSSSRGINFKPSLGPNGTLNVGNQSYSNLPYGINHMSDYKRKIALLDKKIKDLTEAIDEEVVRTLIPNFKRTDPNTKMTVRVKPDDITMVERLQLNKLAHALYAPAIAAAEAEKKALEAKCAATGGDYDFSTTSGNFKTSHPKPVGGMWVTTDVEKFSATHANIFTKWYKQIKNKGQDLLQTGNVADFVVDKDKLEMKAKQLGYSADKITKFQEAFDYFISTSYKKRSQAGLQAAIKNFRVKSSKNWWKGFTSPVPSGHIEDKDGYRIISMYIGGGIKVKRGANDSLQFTLEDIGRSEFNNINRKVLFGIETLKKNVKQNEDEEYDSYSVAAFIDASTALFAKLKVIGFDLEITELSFVDVEPQEAKALKANRKGQSKSTKNKRGKIKREVVSDEDVE